MVRSSPGRSSGSTGRLTPVGVRRDACAHWSGNGTNPFVSHAFLKALEESRSVGTGTGWLSQHVLVRDAESGCLHAAAPCYVKSHSAGEYVFDHSWATAYARAGGRYYPKLQCCVPFTPVTGVWLSCNCLLQQHTGAPLCRTQPALTIPTRVGPRLLVHDQAPPGTADVLAGGLKALAEAIEASSVHVTFPSRREADLLASDSEWLVRSGLQYHWPNHGYGSFADFEAALVQKRRKAVRQERKRAGEGLVISRLRGGDLKPRHWVRASTAPAICLCVLTPSHHRTRSTSSTLTPPSASGAPRT